MVKALYFKSLIVRRTLLTELCVVGNRQLLIVLELGMCVLKELAISTDTVARRYEKLKRNGTIKVLIQLNTAKIGYHGYATFYIAFVSQSSLISMVENLCKIPDVVLIVQTSGSFDLLVEAMIKDLDQLLSVQDNITSMPGVTKCEMHLSRPTPVFPTPREYISTF